MTTNDSGAKSTLVDDLRALFNEIQVLCGEIDERLATDLSEIQDGFSDDELRRLFTEILVHIRGGAEATAEQRVAIAAEVRTLVDDAVERRGQALDMTAAPVLVGPVGEMGPAAVGSVSDSDQVHLELTDGAGMTVRPVRPTPTFLGMNVALTEGFAETKNIAFWEENLRLKIDLANFKRREDRDPEADELRQMLWPKGELPKDDIHKIIPLADDIASRGVQTPPVIDYWGTAWDGNRRLAACLYIITSKDYTQEEKSRARKIRVWQTDEHATKDQIDAIVTSLNFGGDFKMPWPEYVRAQQVYDAYIERRDTEASRRVLSERDETRIRQDIAREFGIKTAEVTRYCKMMVWALEFEDYHREQGREEPDIASSSSAMFQYFYELDSGRGDDKLAAKLRNDDAFRAIVFDLMFDGKFKNWAQIRDLRRVYETPLALDQLKDAHRETSKAVGRERLGEAIDTARQRSVVLRQAGRADELARVTKWINEDATLAVLRKMDLSVLRDFRDAARAVDGMITTLVEGAATPQAGDAP